MRELVSRRTRFGGTGGMSVASRRIQMATSTRERGDERLAAPAGILQARSFQIHAVAADLRWARSGRASGGGQTGDTAQFAVVSCCDHDGAPRAHCTSWHLRRDAGTIWPGRMPAERRKALVAALAAVLVAI